MLNIVADNAVLDQQAIEDFEKNEELNIKNILTPDEDPEILWNFFCNVNLIGKK